MRIVIRALLGNLVTKDVEDNEYPEQGMESNINCIVLVITAGGQWKKQAVTLEKVHSQCDQVARIYTSLLVYTSI